jgi:putative PEP-CTERM system histidine kinase
VNLIAVSYALALIAFLALGLLAAIGWRGKPIGMRLLTACAAMIVWSIAVIGSSFLSEPKFLPVFLPELLRDLTLLWVIFGVAGDSVPRKFKAGTYLAALAVAILGVSRDLFGGWTAFAPTADQLMLGSGLLFAFLGLVSLEQTYRNARASARHALRYLILGFGALFAYDLFMYAQAALYQQIRADAWLVRGAVNALSAPLIAIAMRRNPEWSLDIFVSRQVVFHTTAFLAVGVYLLFVAIGGYYIRVVGGSWGGIAQIFFLSGAIIVLISILFSQILRRRVKVFISKHFYRNKYDYRVTWLQFVQTMSSTGEGDIRATALRAVVQTMGAPSGVLFLADDSGKSFRPAATWPEGAELAIGATEVDASQELVRFLAERQWIVDLNEYRALPDLYQNIVLPAWLIGHPTARIVAPVLELNRLAGFVMLAESTPPFELTFEDRDLLKTLGRHIATSLAQDEASGKLAESRQFEAYNRLTAFMMHDLKNSVAQLKLIVTNAKRHKDNPDFINDTIETIANASDRMTRLIEQLRGDVQQGASQRVDLNDIAAAAVRRCSDRMPAPHLAAADTPIVLRADRERLQAVVEHVIRNAQDATPANGTVTVAVECQEASARLTVTDTGQGMDANFLRDRLFKPFDTTKGSKGMGIGAYQVREYVRSLGGDVEVRSSPGVGTAFSLSFQRFADGKTRMD